MAAEIIVQGAGILVAIASFAAGSRGYLGYRFATTQRALQLALAIGVGSVFLGPGLVRWIRRDGLVGVTVWLVLIFALAGMGYQRLRSRSPILAVAAIVLVITALLVPVLFYAFLSQIFALAVPFLALYMAYQFVRSRVRGF